MSRKKIITHPAVEAIEEAFATGPEYKWEIMLKQGYRFAGYDTHSKNVATVREGVELLDSIEVCPKHCHCKEGVS